MSTRRGIRRVQGAAGATPVRRVASPSRGPGGDAGASLLVAMVFMILFGVISAALLTQGFTSVKTAEAFSGIRARRTAADSAGSAAVNRIKDAPNLGRDPALFTSPADPACVLNVETPVGTLTATCAAVAGSQSGMLPTGAWPAAPEATPLQPRIMTILVCERRSGRDPATTTGPCDFTLDRVLLRAQVRFDVTTDGAGNPAANVPQVLSWDHYR